MCTVFGVGHAFRVECSAQFAILSLITMEKPCVFARCRTWHPCKFDIWQHTSRVEGTFAMVTIQVLYPTMLYDRRFIAPLHRDIFKAAHYMLQTLYITMSQDVRRPVSCSSIQCMSKCKYCTLEKKHEPECRVLVFGSYIHQQTLCNANTDGLAK